MQRVLARILVLSLAVPLPAEFAGGFTVFPFSIVVALLLAMWALDVSCRPAEVRVRRFDPVLTAGVVMAAAVLMSNVVTGATWQFFSLWVWVVALYACARYRVPALLDARAVAILRGLVVALALLGVVQIVTGRPIGALAQYFERDVRAALVYEGVGGGAIFKRVQATFFSVDLFAMFVAYAFFFALGLMLASGRRERVASTAAALALFCIAFTFSRGVWIAVTIGTTGFVLALLAAGLLSTGRLVKSTLVSAGVVATLLAVAPSAVSARFEAGQVDQSVTVRQNALDVGVSVIEARPWFGVGYLAFVEASDELGLNQVGNRIRPHNVYVQIWSEQGLLVLLAYLGLGATLIAEGVRCWAVPGRGPRVFGTAVVAMVVASGIFGLVYAQAAEYSVVPGLFAFTGLALGFAARARPARTAGSGEARAVESSHGSVLASSMVTP